MIGFWKRQKFSKGQTEKNAFESSNYVPLEMPLLHMPGTRQQTQGMHISYSFLASGKIWHTSGTVELKLAQTKVFTQEKSHKYVVAFEIGAVR